MPRLIPAKPVFGPDEIVVCWMSHSLGERTIPAGTVVRGDDPATQANPSYFRRRKAVTNALIGLAAAKLAEPYAKDAYKKLKDKKK